MEDHIHPYPREGARDVKGGKKNEKMKKHNDTISRRAALAAAEDIIRRQENNSSDVVKAMLDKEHDCMGDCDDGWVFPEEEDE